jgi:hypothetical protein
MTLDEMYEIGLHRIRECQRERERAEAERKEKAGKHLLACIERNVNDLPVPISFGVFTLIGVVRLPGCKVFMQYALPEDEEGWEWVKEHCPHFAVKIEEGIKDACLYVFGKWLTPEEVGCK